MDVLLMKVPEAAAALGVSRAKLYELIARGALPAVKVDGCRQGAHGGPGVVRQQATPDELNGDQVAPGTGTSRFVG